MEESTTARYDPPGAWNGKLEYVVKIGERIIAVRLIFPRDKSLSLHGVSFIKMKGALVSERMKIG